MRLNSLRNRGVTVGSVIRIKDVSKVLTKLNREIEGIQGRSLSGLIKAAALIRNETEHGSVKTPVDLGNLRASWFTVSANTKIMSGGGRTHRPEGQAAKFVGPKAGALSTGHASMLTEMQGKAIALSNVHNGPFVIMGYSANYAMYVHEFIGKEFKRPGANAKWFESAIKKQKDNIVKVVKENARIKK